jgi:hypothetical protein
MKSARPFVPLAHRIRELQAELERALDELAVEQKAENFRHGPGTEGCTPPVQYFRQELDKAGYGHCLCRAYLAAKDE